MFPLIASPHPNDNSILFMRGSQLSSLVCANGNHLRETQNERADRRRQAKRAETKQSLQQIQVARASPLNLPAQHNAFIWIYVP
jgi:hypothetical protein